MASHCLLHAHPSAASVNLKAFGVPEPDFADIQGSRRAKIWDLTTSLHCSIVGTCLTSAEWRQFFIRFGDSNARTATEHNLHGLGVRAASRGDDIGKRLNKALDKRHETTIRRFQKATGPTELRALWAQSLEQGDIAGPYWALLTHPSADTKLVQEVFGDVHMLSHQVGAAARLDIAQLRRLERELRERDDKIARQEARLQTGAAEREALRQSLDQSLIAVASRNASDAADPAIETFAARVTVLEKERADESVRASAIEQRWRLAETQRDKSANEVAELTLEMRALRRELLVLELAIANETGPTSEPLETKLAGAKILYVGGRPKLFEQLKAYVSARGGVLLAHDGGIDDNPALLPGLISQAGAVMFPVDCISHSAAEQVKKICRRLGKPWTPLRSASLASFVARITADPLPQALILA